MSYILDALNKSERARGTSASSSADPIVATAVTPESRFRLPLMLALVALFSALATWLLLGSGEPEEPESGAAPPPARNVASAPPVQAITSSRLPSSVGVQDRPSRDRVDHEVDEPPEASKHGASTLEPSPPRDEESLLRQATVAATRPADSALSRGDNAQDRTVPSAEPPPLADLAPSTLGERVDSEAAPAPLTSFAPLPPRRQQSSRPTHHSLPRLSELDPAFSERLPPLSLDVHAYDSDPARRFILLNLNRAIEGQRVSIEGRRLRVTEIVPEGVVLEVEGVAFLLPL